MKNESIKALVDEGTDLNDRIKKLEARLESIKADLKHYAEQHEATMLNGYKSSVKISPTTSTSVDLKEVWERLADRKIDRFLMFVNPKLEAIRPVVSGEVANKILQTEQKNKFGKLSFIRSGTDSKSGAKKATKRIK